MDCNRETTLPRRCVRVAMVDSIRGEENTWPERDGVGSEHMECKMKAPNVKGRY